MGKQKDARPAPTRQSAGEREARMAGARAWCVVIQRFDGKRRVFAEFAPDDAGKGRAARMILQLRKVGCIAELVAKSALGGMELRR